MKAIVNYPGHPLHKQIVEAGGIKEINHRGFARGRCYAVKGNVGSYSGDWWLPVRTVRPLVSKVAA